MNINEIINKVELEGAIEINGSYLYTKAQIQAEQRIWWSWDKSKNVDFSGYPYWIITDNGEHLGFDSEELEEGMKEYGIIA